MKKDKTSMTAIGIAVTRAIESERPANERLIYDPFARQFVPGWMVRATALTVASGYAEWRGPGVMGYLIARERYINRSLLETSQTNSEVKGMRRYHFMTGEGLSFGLHPAEVEAYLKSLGFSQARNIGAAELAQRYCTGGNARRKIAGGYGIATGIV